MFFYSPSFYVVTVVLQIICIVHCIRKGRQTNWIWLLIFIPLIGSVVYIFTEMFSGNEIQQVQSGVSGVFNPGGKIRKLENNLKFSDTFNNRLMLADAYLAAGHTERAIDLYESSLTGNFIGNEYLLSQLIIAYFQVKRYEDLIRVAKKIHDRPQFARSKQHIYYAMALDFTGKKEEAEAEFKMMKGKFSNFEARYQYGCFLERAGIKEEARQLFNEVLSEVTHLSPLERRNNSKWFALIKEELKKLKS
jgi:hypothetical protein